MPTYSFVEVNATLVASGAVLDLGAGSANSEEGITVVAAGDKNTMTVGADGEVMHSLHADKSGQVTLRYLKTSPTNAKLMAIYDAQGESAALWGSNVIAITLPSTGEVISCRSCAFKKVPDINYQKDGGTVEWVFDAGKIDRIMGTF
ncbi:phage protein [Uliginosibacterium sp. sgz301328]|uniref:phage structural protein n=1 Tax=Uliginosibacterium sp. sgz301328 TaxID=3243764 RepID=UPI00359E3D9F